MQGLPQELKENLNSNRNLKSVEIQLRDSPLPRNPSEELDTMAQWDTAWPASTSSQVQLPADLRLLHLKRLNNKILKMVSTRYKVTSSNEN